MKRRRESSPPSPSPFPGGSEVENCHNSYKKTRKHKGSKRDEDDCQIKERWWPRRYKLFSKFDKGIKLDKESWYSVTPEAIAEQIASKLSPRGINNRVIVDAFCGCGGNTIQFAKMCDVVIAIDVDPLRIANCRHNAKIYGVEDKIQFIIGDFMKIGPSLRADAVFLSPPWGGPKYRELKEFDLRADIPNMDGVQVFEIAKAISPNIAYYLPKNVIKEQVKQLGGEECDFEIEENRLKGKVKAVTAYFWGLVQKPGIHAIQRKRRRPKKKKSFVGHKEKNPQVKVQASIAKNRKKRKINKNKGIRAPQIKPAATIINGQLQMPPSKNLRNRKRKNKNAAKLSFPVSANPGPGQQKPFNRKPRNKKKGNIKVKLVAPEQRQASIAKSQRNRKRANKKGRKKTEH